MKSVSTASQAGSTTRAEKRSGFSAILRIVLMFGLLLGLAALFSGPAAARPAAQGPLDETIYLAVVWDTLSGPISPVNGAVLNTLIPELQFWWNAEVDARGCLAYDTSPAPRCNLWFWRDGGLESFQPWENLAPATKYYWRVGTIVNDDTAHPIWSKEWSFTTGSRGTILPAPTLVSPANNVAIPQSSLILSWNPVAGAEEYALWVYSPTEYRNTIYHSTGTSKDFRFVIGNTWKKDIPYQWYVTVRNDYGWSVDSARRNFTLTSVNSPGLSGDLQNAPILWGLDELGIKIFQMGQ